MKFVCANADLVQNINLDTDYDYITASSKSLIMAVETLANSFTKSKSDCVLFVWNTNDPSDLVRATEEACVEDVNFKKIIDDLEKNLDYSILGDFDLESIELENGMTISVVKYVTMNNFVESKKSARKSIKESSVGYYIYSKPLGDKYAYCDKSKFTEEGFYLIEDYMLDAIHIFETEKEAQKFIDKYAKRFMVDEDNIIIAEYPSNKLGFFESKKSATKSIKESKETWEDIDGKFIYFKDDKYEIISQSDRYNYSHFDDAESWDFMILARKIKSKGNLETWAIFYGSETKFDYNYWDEDLAGETVDSYRSDAVYDIGSEDEIDEIWNEMN